MDQDPRKLASHYCPQMSSTFGSHVSDMLPSGIPPWAEFVISLLKMKTVRRVSVCGT